MWLRSWRPAVSSLQPVAEPRPLPDQGFVGDLDLLLVAGQEPVPGQYQQHLGRGRVVVEVEL
jgi:hypothetical protein